MKGSFTGANANRKGLFEAANSGTIFLDEIGEMSPAMQVKLLRVLQERRLRPVGATEETVVDTRVIAATNRDLASMVKDGTFREDLFFGSQLYQSSCRPCGKGWKTWPSWLNISRTGFAPSLAAP